MNKVRICNKDYNVSKRVYYHIQGLETENRLFSIEIKGHEKNEISLQQENKQLKDNINKYIDEKLWEYFDERNTYLSVKRDIENILKGDSNEK